MAHSSDAVLEKEEITRISDEELEAFNKEPISAERLAAFADQLAISAVSDSLTNALNADSRSLRAVAQAAFMDPGHLSRLANGRNCEVETLARIALSMGKSLHISIE